MAITDKTRKLLWGKSANRCAICRQELSKEATEKDTEAVIGEECHIIAREINGPRGNNPLPLDQRDEYHNLILLCRNHHKEIDAQPNTFTVELLRDLKVSHEAWVQTALEPEKRAAKPPSIFFLFRIDTGKQLCDSVIACHALHFDNDPLEAESETEAIGEFMQYIQDYGDIWSEIGVKGRIEAQAIMDKQVKSLKSLGFLVYATSRQERYTAESIQGSIDFDVGYVFVVRDTNPLTVKKDEKTEETMKLVSQVPSKHTHFIPVLKETSRVRFI